MTLVVDVVKNSPNTRFQLYLDILSQNPATNQTVVRVTRQAYNGPSGNTSSFFGGPGSQGSQVVGYGGIAARSQSPFLPSGYAQNQLRWSDFNDIVLTHDANGYWLGGTTLTGTMIIQYGTINEAHNGSISIPRIPRVPQAPNTPTASEVSVNQMRMTWNIPDNMGAAIDQMLLRVHTNPNPDAAGYTNYVLGGSVTTYLVTGLSPGTTYYAKVYAHNGVGYSPGSGVRAQSTLPAGAPSVLVTPALNGGSASVALSPPGGASGVTDYEIERRVSGTTSPVTTLDTPSSPVTVPGLTPGTTYEWRASAWFGTFQSPWSDWTPVLQPSPNTNPGDYFDGSTDPRDDLTFSWDSTTDNSISLATGRGVEGWLTFDEGNDDSGAEGVVYQVTGGKVGAFATRVTFWTDATDAGQISGVAFEGGGEVEADTAYRALIHVQLLERGQRMQPGIACYEADGTPISIIWGDAVELSASPDWQQLYVAGTTPPLTAIAAAVMRDNGSSSEGFGHGPFGHGPFGGGGEWALWRAGDTYLMDAAFLSLGLYPYFDGDTPDVPGYDYEWLGDPNQSASARYVVIYVAEDPLADPDCPPPPQPPRPPSIPADCIDEVGTWRRYTVQVPASEVRATGATLPTLKLETGVEAERQIRIRVYANPTGVAPELVDLSVWESEQIISYMPPDAVITLDGVTQSAWAEVAGGEPISASKLLYGTNGVPATWPELDCGIGYIYTFDVPTESSPGNLGIRLLLTHRL